MASDPPSPVNQRLLDLEQAERIAELERLTADREYRWAVADYTAPASVAIPPAAAADAVAPVAAPVAPAAAHAAVAAPGPDDLLDVREAAALLRMSVKDLDGMRRRETGPPFKRVGKLIRYRRGDLLQITVQNAVQGKPSRRGNST